MILPMQHKANWALITQRKQQVINKSNIRENKSRLPCTYEVGNKVLLEKPGLTPKMAAPRTGPCAVTKAHDNGTVTIQKNNVVEQVINIRRLTPYKSK